MPTNAPSHVDEHAYARLVAPYRCELHAHCRRMLRSPDEAEDALQEALLRAWRGLPSFEGRSSPRAWLYRIATNACLDEIDRRRARVVPLDGASPFDVGPTDGPTALEPVDPSDTPQAGYERRESLEQALATAFACLGPRGRTVFVLRTALGFRAREVAKRLDTSVASVNSAVQRARATLAAEPVVSHVNSGTSARIRSCADAIERGDAERLIALLGED
jgi:RNA polymerase sigma-70 factor (ECF subfamily)